MDYQKIIDKYYPAGNRLRDIYMRHARQVADKALEIAETKGLDIDRTTLDAAAMLHDIGIFLTDAPGIDCHGSKPYLMHGVLGAALLRTEGVDEAIARVAERHTGAGITAEEISRFNLPMPEGDYCPVTELEKLVCYADKFYSKSGDMREKTLDRVRAAMSKFSPETLDRFNRLHEEFDIDG